MDSVLRQLEAEAIFIMRETAAEFKNPVMLYSVGKDSSVMVRLAQKAFHPEKMPFPLMHVDTGFKPVEMYKFRDQFVKNNGLNLIVERNSEWIEKGCNPHDLGCDACCRHLKTDALLQAIAKHGFDAAFGGARREEEKSRAKERIFSVRDKYGQWDPKQQRPEIWNLYNTEIAPGQTVRIFPLSNWTEQDVWRYISEEQIPVVPLYFAQKRKVVRKGNAFIPATANEMAQAEDLLCRFRSLGCTHCSGVVESDAESVDDIMKELGESHFSERQYRLIDLTSDSSMEQKKKEGYF